MPGVIPALVENEISQAVSNQARATTRTFWMEDVQILDDVRVGTQDDVGSRGEQLAGQFALRLVRMALVFLAPMHKDDDNVGARADGA